MMKVSNAVTFLLALVVLTGAVAGPVSAANETATETETAIPTETQTATQTPNETATATATPIETETATPAQTEAGSDDESETCEVDPNRNLLSQKRLYAQEQTVEAGSPGEIAGGFQVAPGVDCPIVVRVTMQVPSGMQISGTSDVITGGAGMVSGTFVVDESSGIKDVRANVFSTNTGERTVTADIAYWPQGHEEMSRELDGLSFTFDVESASEDLPAENASAEGSSDTRFGAGSIGDVPFAWGVVGGLMALLLVAIVARR